MSMDAPAAILNTPEAVAQPHGQVVAGTLAPAIDVRNVEKIYRGNTHALRGVSLRVNRGEIFGLLGPNGAGKSTLVKILMSVISPTRCEGTVLGMPVGHKPTFARVGYLPEHHRFPEYLSGAQVLEYFAALSNVPRLLRHQRCEELLKLVGMQGWGNVRVKRYSKGMRQRIGLAQALMNDPDLIILDEPTDGVDPVGRLEIRKVLLKQKELGKAVFVNSHLLSELELVCDRVAIMVKGRVTSQGTLDELTSYGQRYEIEVDESSFRPNAASRAELLEQVLRARLVNHLSPLSDEELKTANDANMTNVNGVVSETARPIGVLNSKSGERIALHLQGSIVVLRTQSAAMIQPVIDALRTEGLVIRAVRDCRPSLEDLFMRAVQDPRTGAIMTIGAKTTQSGATE